MTQNDQNVTLNNQNVTQNDQNMMQNNCKNKNQPKHDTNKTSKT